MEMKYNRESVLAADMKLLAGIIKDKYKIDIFQKGRKREIVEARVAASYALNEIGYAITSISRVLNIDHSTGIHYKKKFEKTLPYSKGMREVYNLCKSVLSGLEKDRDIETDSLSRITILQNRVSELTLEVEQLKAKLREKDDRQSKLNPIVKVLKDRMPSGAEEEVKRRLYWLLNSIADERKTA